jgi:hypothetical protein
MTSINVPRQHIQEALPAPNSPSTGQTAQFIIYSPKKLSMVSQCTKCSVLLLCVTLLASCAKSLSSADAEQAIRDAFGAQRAVWRINSDCYTHCGGKPLKGDAMFYKGSLQHVTIKQIGSRKVAKWPDGFIKQTGYWPVLAEIEIECECKPHDPIIRIEEFLVNDYGNGKYGFEL